MRREQAGPDPVRCWHDIYVRELSTLFIWTRVTSSPLSVPNGPGAHKDGGGNAKKTGRDKTASRCPVYSSIVPVGQITQGTAGLSWDRRA